MPTYDFRCTNGHDFEQFYRRISEAPSTTECPQCGATAERRVSGGAGLLFKGSGFYLTDYGKNAHRTSGPASGSTGGDKGEGGAKSDAGGGKGDAGGGKGDGGSSGSSGSSTPTSGGSSGGASGGSSGGSTGGSSSAKGE